MPSTTPVSAPQTASLAPLPPAWRIEVFRADGFDDPDGTHALADVRELGIANVTALRRGRGYLLSPDYSEAEIKTIAREFLSDPVVDQIRITKPSAEPESSAAHRLLVARRPGVMDPVAQTVRNLLSNTGHTPGSAGPEVQTFSAWELEGDLSAADLRELGRKILANETIELLLVDEENLPFGAPGGSGARGPVDVPLLHADDAELLRLSSEGGLSLSLTEMHTIRDHFQAIGREPTACELETLAQTWSEHCKHKTLCGRIEFTDSDGQVQKIDNLLRSTIGRATRELDKPWCVSVFVDNAGIVEFEPGWDVCFKVETHNHPSAIDPYGGAGTGIGGVIRDILGAGLGARPIANTDSFFVGPWDLPAARIPKGTMHPRRILRGVVAGVRDYGNRMGIPTINGGVWFHERYTANPLVFAGTVGLIPRDCVHKEVHPGDLIVSVGGRTGRDGIHGATFSSIELSEDSETVSSSAVQIGDPITEKRVLDCLLVARDKKLYRGITDCGAGGFSSAVGEMGEECGAEVELASVPLKYPGLASHEIWISEAQERMVLAVPPENEAELLALFASEDVEATTIGRFTDSGRLVLKDGGKCVGDISMEFLHKGCPRPMRSAVWEAPKAVDLWVPPAPDAGELLLALLASPNICSREWIIRQYDHEVKGMSVVKPLVGLHADGPSDAAVIKPLPDSDKGLAISCGTNPEYGLIDPRAMTLAAIDEALRNAVAVGADPRKAAILDNFSWGNCDKPDRLGSLVRAAQACYDGAMAYGTPFISGKDSLNNEYRVGGESISIPPTLLISAIAPVPRVGACVTMDLKQAGNALYLVGKTRVELGGSHYFMQRGQAGGKPPEPDLASAPKLLESLHLALAAGNAVACHDLSEGGLAVAAAEMAGAGGLGIQIELAKMEIEQAKGLDLDSRDATRLFSESCTRFLVEVPASKQKAFEAALAGQPICQVGQVTDDERMVVLGEDAATVLVLGVDALRSAHASGPGSNSSNAANQKTSR